jgi:hypothetical protein
MKYIFVDLDNTLISADQALGNPPKNSKTITLKNSYSVSMEDKYYGVLRPGALLLLAKLREIANVYLLTAAAKDYAEAWNKEFELGFKKEDIYSREDSESYKLKVGSKFKVKGDVYLIDDKALPFEKTYKKVNFLGYLGKVEVITVPPYHGHKNQNLDDKKISDIVNKIVSV